MPDMRMQVVHEAIATYAYAHAPLQQPHMMTTVGFGHKDLSYKNAWVGAACWLDISCPYMYILLYVCRTHQKTKHFHQRYMISFMIYSRRTVYSIWHGVIVASNGQNTQHVANLLLKYDHQDSFGRASTILLLHSLRHRSIQLGS